MIGDKSILYKHCLILRRIRLETKLQWMQSLTKLLVLVPLFSLCPIKATPQKPCVKYVNGFQLHNSFTFLPCLTFGDSNSYSLCTLFRFCCVWNSKRVLNVEHRSHSHDSNWWSRDFFHNVSGKFELLSHACFMKSRMSCFFFSFPRWPCSLVFFFGFQFRYSSRCLSRNSWIPHFNELTKYRTCALALHLVSKPNFQIQKKAWWITSKWHPCASRDSNGITSTSM